MAARGRPYLRTHLAQSVYDKMLNDEKLKIMDFSMWYKVHDVCLSEASKSLFIPMNLDDETQRFVDSCFEQADYFLLQIWHSIAKSFLGLFMTQTSVNGLLNRGRMFVWSKEQAKKLLGESFHKALLPLRDSKRAEGNCVVGVDSFLCNVPESSNPDCVPSASSSSSSRERAENCNIFVDVASGGNNEVLLKAHPKQSLSITSGLSNEISDRQTEAIRPEDGYWWAGKVVLDLGAGDGHVTQILSEYARKVYVTETSPVMRKRLNDKGYTVLGADSWDEEADEAIDLITCLNLLDRCDMPATLLRTIHRKLSPEGKLVIAIVLPISPYVETGTTDHEPSENLGITGVMIEDQVNSLIGDVFPSFGFNTIRWTRLPYLCEGDMDQAFYWLSDIIFILKKRR